MNKEQLYENFSSRHIGPNSNDTDIMLKQIGVKSLDELIELTIPSSIRLKKDLILDEPLTEQKYLSYLQNIASKNKIFKSYLGLGYYPTITPSVIKRNILENPGWYTQYTPYQAEISQGRLEALLNFQTVITDLTGLAIANASLLDEGTATAEAMILLFNFAKSKRLQGSKIFVSENCFPQTISLIKTRAIPLNIKVIIGDEKSFIPGEDFFAIIVQNPDRNGVINDFTELFKTTKQKNVFNIICYDLLSLTLLKTPKDMGAGVAVGSTQRFGIPMMFGGPHAAYFATKEEFKRHIPGRIIGLSVDATGNKAYRMALQTREQHIKREKATSNICTSQVLLAIMAGMFAVFHGKEGLLRISKRIAKFTSILSKILGKLNFNQVNETFFDTIQVKVDKNLIHTIKEQAEKRFVNFRYESDSIFISLSELTTIEDIIEIVDIFNINNLFIRADRELNEADLSILEIDSNLLRISDFLQNPIFSKFHSETELLRYIKALENRDLSLTSSIIPLGSCTMKLNASTEMFGISFPEFLNIHPFAPEEQTLGYLQLIGELEKDLSEITGFETVSFQPNSGAQGEYAGLMVIREYHKNNGNIQRNIALIPSSAHGTNPASAVMAGMKVVVVNCDEQGNIDINDLERKASENKDYLSALMVTYPSTHGVFEENIIQICKIIHKYGGQVYMDGANMNAQVGLTSPALIGADVCHLNLHKTFCIPHGGGGPGVGPIAVAKHLVNYLPNHSSVKIGGVNSFGQVSSSPYGSAGILPISHSYIKMMGNEGLKLATKYAILNANYIKSKLEKYYNVLYKGINGFVAHELIFDLREFKNKYNIEAEDIAKRLMDYGFHAPTVSFPVPGTFMVEPTESESLEELDNFCKAMIAIKKEINEIADGEADSVDNVLKNAPHTAESLISDKWEHKYSREKAAFPIEDIRLNKFWPCVSRINNAYGDRNLICSCPSISNYEDER